MKKNNEQLVIFGPNENPMATFEKKEKRQEFDGWDWSMMARPSEIMDDDGWIYERKRGNKKGKRLRKWFTLLNQGYNYDDRIRYWKPKLADLRLCEENRWRAIQYQKWAWKPLNDIFDLVVKNLPFYAVTLQDDKDGWPKTQVVMFPKHDRYDGVQGVSTDWLREGKEPPKNMPLKQEIGEQWFYYEKRSREVRQRVGYFEALFKMALERRYADRIYRDIYQSLKIDAVINGRHYLLGRSSDYGHGFGVIAYPESTLTEIVE